MKAVDASWREWAQQFETLHEEKLHNLRQKEEAFTERNDHFKKQYEQQVNDERREKERLEREKSEMEKRLMDEKKAEQDALKMELVALQVSRLT